jgi:hypothetical protein
MSHDMGGRCDGIPKFNLARATNYDRALWTSLGLECPEWFRTEHPAPCGIDTHHDPHDYTSGPKP